MAENNGIAGRLQALRDSAKGALRRLAPGRESAPAASDGDKEAPRPAFSDPTRVLFPGDAPSDVDDDESALAGLPLAMMLERSAQDIVRRADGLREDANQLVEKISARVEGEITVRAQAARYFIALGWLGVAGWLYVSALNAQADDLSVLQNGMPVDDAFVLTRVFLVIALAGFGVAFLVNALATALGRADNKAVRRQGEALGHAIAGDSREFDRILTEMRDAMDKRPDEAVRYLSRAHLVALEACAYFREISFLTHTEGDDARRQFAHFLWRRPVNPDPGLSFLSGAIVSVLIYRFVDWYFFTERAPNPDATPLPITEYPWALAVLFLGGLAYAAVGVVFASIGGVIAGDTAGRARAEALDAVRGAFTSHEAPRPGDIIRRIEDAVDVFRARVGGRAASRAHDAEANHADAENADPPWRNRDSSAKFVETGFASAPQSWRADAYAKKFEAGEAQETGSKRGLLGLKNRSRD